MSDRALVGNAADVKQVRKAKQYEKQRAEIDRADLEQVLSLQAGRRFIWKQLADAGVFRLSYAGDSHATAFNEGRRNQGLALLLAVQQLDPKLYHVMAQEAQDFEQAYTVRPPEQDTKQHTAETEENES
jgi:hypothetical protein